jgi:hypothetical protein
VVGSGGWGVAGPEGLLSAYGSGAAHEFAYPVIALHDVRGEHLVAGELRKLHPSSDPAIGMLEGSLALQPASQQSAGAELANRWTAPACAVAKRDLKAGRFSMTTGCS